jgi:hypothetical protein
MIIMESSSPTILDLAARVEGLTGPCRETDCLIFEMGHRLLTPARRGTIDGEPTGQYFGLNGDLLPECAPTYTASLDAAMTLVPEGLTRLVRDGSESDCTGDNRPYANIGRETGEAHAATMELAVVAASLRARATLESTQ